MKNVCWLAIIGVSLSLCSCSKETISPTSNAAARVGTVSTVDGSEPRPPHERPTPIEVSALPATVTNTISTRYAGATIERAGTDKDGNFAILVIQNKQPKGLLFSAEGDYLKELPPPGGPGHGPHDGTATKPGSGTGVGPGQHPGPPPALTKVELTALPTAIPNYIKSKFASAEIKRAGKDPEGNFVVLIIHDNKPKGLLFNSAGAFQKLLPPPPGGPGQGPRPGQGPPPGGN